MEIEGVVFSHQTIDFFHLKLAFRGIRQVVRFSRIISHELESFGNVFRKSRVSERLTAYQGHGHSQRSQGLSRTTYRIEKY